MQSNGPFGPPQVPPGGFGAPPSGFGPPSGGFGPPPGAWGAPPGMTPPWASPMGPSMAIAPAGTGGFAAKYVALGAYALLAVSGVATVALAMAQNTALDDGPRNSADGGALIAAACVLGVSFVTYAGAVLTWIYKSWEFIPQPYRRNASGRVFTPGAAVGMNFVPLYNLYWFFAQNLGYCEALDAVMIQSGRSARAPKNLALGAAIVQVIPYVNYVFGPLVWMVYMFVVDGVKKQLLAAPPR